MKNCFRVVIQASFALLLIMTLVVSTQVQGAETLKIGLIAPLSGPGLAWGEAMLVPVQVLAEEINAKGGLKVGNKVYNIVVIPYDDKYTGEGGVAAATRLVYEDKVKFIIGPISSASLLAFLPITHKENVLVVGNTYSNNALGPDKPLYFRIAPTSNEFSEPQIAWLSKKYPKLKTVVICTPNDETGKEMVVQNVKAYEKYGFKILSTEWYQRGLLNMAPLITRVLPMKPDILESSGSAPGDVANLYKTARSMGYQGMLIRTGGEATEAILGAAGKSVEGMIYHIDVDIDNPKGELATLINKVKEKKPGRSITSSVPLWYTGCKMLLECIQKAGTVEDTQAVKRVLEEMKEYRNFVGRFQWTGKETYGINHQLTGPMYVGQIINGKPTTIAEVTQK